MDDADEIILQALKQLGCDLSPSIRTLAQLSVDDATKATVRCLHVLGWLKDASSTEVPVNTAAKFRLCSQLAQTIKTLGYDGDLGYQSFLYLTDTELRRIFSFLLGKVPRDQDLAGVGDGADSRASMVTSIKVAIRDSLSKSWLPWYCRDVVRSDKGLDFVPVDFTFASDIGYLPGCERLTLDNQLLLASLVHSYSLYESESPEQPESAKARHLRRKIRETLTAERSRVVEKLGLDVSRDTGGMLKQLRELDITSIGKAATSEQLHTSAELPNGGVEEPGEDEVETLVEHLATTLEALAKAKREVEKLESKLDQAHALILSESAEVKQKAVEFVKKQTAFELVPEATENVRKLSAGNSAGRVKLEEYDAGWRNRRQALIEEIDKLRTEWVRQHEAGDTLREELSSLQAREVSNEDEKRSKAAQIERLITALKHRTRDANRSVYTQRIFEIVGNIKKQCREIDKVLEDTRTLQKSINLLEGKLDRSFTIADELIFRDAKKDERIRRAYKNLAALREGYDLLITAVRDIGAMTREIRDLEDQVEQDKTKNVVSNLEGIQRDFAEMKAENAVLREKLESES